MGAPRPRRKPEVGAQLTRAPDAGGPTFYGRRQGRKLRPGRRDLANVRIFADDVRLLLPALPAGSLDRVFLLFPDPWPKTRHAARRFVCRDTLDRLAVLMRPGAELRIASDDPTYIAWALGQTLGHPAFAWLARQAADWRRPPPDWVPTRYEAKALAAGRRPAYLRFRRRPPD